MIMDNKYEYNGLQEKEIEKWGKRTKKGERK